MTNNYAEREPGGRGGGGHPPTPGQPWAAGGTWTGFPGAIGGLGKVHRFGKQCFSENVHCRLSPNVRNTNGK